MANYRDNRKYVMATPIKNPIKESKVMDYIDTVRQQIEGVWVDVYEVSIKLKVKEAIVRRVFMTLNRVMSQPGHNKRSFYVYPVVKPKVDFGRMESLPALSTSPKWGAQKRLILRRIRESHPWVIEEWYPQESRWFLYIDGIDPFTQTQVSKGVLKAWHFELPKAMEVVRTLRGKKQSTFRIRDTRLGDTIAADIIC